jgi:hypothetical protein
LKQRSKEEDSVIGINKVKDVEGIDIKDMNE